MIQVEAVLDYSEPQGHPTELSFLIVNLDPKEPTCLGLGFMISL